MVAGVERPRTPMGCMVGMGAVLVFIFLYGPLDLVFDVVTAIEDPEDRPPPKNLRGEVVRGPLEGRRLPDEDDELAPRPRDREEEQAIAVFGAYDGESLKPKEEEGWLTAVPPLAWAGMAGVGVLGAMGAIGWLVLGGREPESVVDPPDQDGLSG